MLYTQALRNRKGLFKCQQKKIKVAFKQDFIMNNKHKKLKSTKVIKSSKKSGFASKNINNFSKNFKLQPNQVIISGNDKYRGEIVKLIEILDQPIKQVFVEAIVAELSTSKAKELGLQFSGSSGKAGLTVLNKNSLSANISVNTAKQINQETMESFAKGYVKSPNSLFTLFTSGSTGAPKGITHSTGGYLLYSKLTCQNQFGMNENSIVLTASDAGWINGHTYSLFGPLSLGATTIILEKPILILNKTIFDHIIDLGANIIYLPVTLIRILSVAI